MIDKDWIFTKTAETYVAWLQLGAYASVIFFVIAYFLGLV